MSGVTVATTSRSIEDAVGAGLRERLLERGPAKIGQGLLGRRDRRSRMPVRSMIHSSFVSTMAESSSFVITRSGTYEPMPVIAARNPSGAFRSPLDRERQRRPRSQLAADARLGLASPDRAADAIESHTSSSSSPGSTMRLKRQSSIPAK